MIVPDPEELRVSSAVSSKQGHNSPDKFSWHFKCAIRSSVDENIRKWVIVTAHMNLSWYRCSRGRLAICAYGHTMAAQWELPRNPTASETTKIPINKRMAKTTVYNKRILLHSKKEDKGELPCSYIKYSPHTQTYIHMHTHAHVHTHTYIMHPRQSSSRHWHLTGMQ